MNKLLLEKIKEFQKETEANVVYITEYGSKLFGTNNENSDVDYKGIFIPSKESLLTKTDVEHYNFTTGKKDSKNTADDIDIELWSIHKFINLVKKGETGAIDILFSFFREDTIIYKDDEFYIMIKALAKNMVNKNLHSFVGYCVDQSKKYNIKGERYNELDLFYKALLNLRETMLDINMTEKLSFIWSSLKNIVNDFQFKYIKFIMAPGPRGSGDYKDIEYIEILGKKFEGNITIQYFMDKVEHQYNQFGDRTKASAEGIDHKALSHAVRVILEVEELLDTGFLQFPLKDREWIKKIKYKEEDFETVMNFIDTKLDEVNRKMEESTLPEKNNPEYKSYMHTILLSCLL